jgi:hypothetical protein
MVLTYFLNDFEMVPVAPIITGIALVFTLHIRCISIVRLLLLLAAIELTPGDSSGVCLTPVERARKNLNYGSRKVPRYPGGSSTVHIYTSLSDFN